jgi:hypothetical protein
MMDGSTGGRLDADPSHDIRRRYVAAPRPIGGLTATPGRGMVRPHSPKGLSCAVSTGAAGIL